MNLPCTTVLVSVTSACAYHCSHCYQKNDIGRDVVRVLLSFFEASGWNETGVSRLRHPHRQVFESATLFLRPQICVDYSAEGISVHSASILLYSDISSSCSEVILVKN